MFMVDLSDDIITVAHACMAADHALSGVAPPDELFGVPAGSTASLPLSALYQALAVAFETAAYAGEVSYTFGKDARAGLNLAALEERYGGQMRRRKSAAPAGPTAAE